jgi:hypothetical protein
MSVINNQKVFDALNDDVMKNEAPANALLCGHSFGLDRHLNGLGV